MLIIIIIGSIDQMMIDLLRMTWVLDKNRVSKVKYFDQKKNDWSVCYWRVFCIGVFECVCVCWHNTFMPLICMYACNGWINLLFWIKNHQVFERKNLLIDQSIDQSINHDQSIREDNELFIHKNFFIFVYLFYFR